MCASGAAGRGLLTTLLSIVALSCAPDPIDEIREEDLRADLFELASDRFRGRETGTLDELTASVWLAERAREAGLEPAGDDGTYYQFFPVERFRVSQGSRVLVGGVELRIGEDVIPANTVLARVDAPALLVADAAEAELSAEAASGRAIVSRYPPESTGGQNRPSLAGWGRAMQRALGPDAGEAAIVIVVPESEREQWASAALRVPRGSYAIDPTGEDEPRRASPGTPTLYVREGALQVPITSGDRLDAFLFIDSYSYPSVNVVARVPGRDPTLAAEHVLFSAHQDHNGVRAPVEGDSIVNGADDNATTAVALLAIGRAFASSPGRRTALFVWHGAEERGLFGSRWFAERPTVPRGSIVAVLNGDMIGRNSPDSAALLGAIPPHRNSEELVAMALAANEAVAGFVVDHSWDDPEHDEGFYFRSDHLPYARAGIPAIYFTAMLHRDYHTPLDNPDRIDLEKLTGMTRWMYATGRAVAEADLPPALDQDFQLERCRDFTGVYCE